jgi:hypothetical protein
MPKRLAQTFKWTLWLPALVVIGGYALIRRLLVKSKTDSELRAAEKARQKQIRRRLRGLDDMPPAKAA